MILDVLYTVAILVLLYLTIKYVMVLMELHKYPPGPFPLPLIGNLHLIGKQPEKSFKKLSMKYGDVMSLSFGSQRVVVINSIHPGNENVTCATYATCHICTPYAPNVVFA